MDDPAVVDRVLDYLYTLDYYATPEVTDHAGINASTISFTSEVNYRHHRLIMNTKVYAMADRLGIPQLKQLAREKFEGDAVEWPNVDFHDVVSEVTLLFTLLFTFPVSPSPHSPKAKLLHDLTPRSTDPKRFITRRNLHAGSSRQQMLLTGIAEDPRDGEAFVRCADVSDDFEDGEVYFV